MAKPNLVALRGQSVDLTQLAAMFERMTGRKPTEQELEEARAELASTDESGELPQAHFGTAKETPPNFRTQEPDEDADDEEMAETPPDVVAMLGFDPLDSEE